MTGRPTPLRDAVRTHGVTPTLAGGTVSALLAAGLISQAQVSAVTGLLGLGIIALSIAVPLLTARQVVRAGENDVTPTSDPRTDDGDPLVPLTGHRLGEVLTHVLAGLQDLHSALPAPGRYPDPTPTAPQYTVPDEHYDPEPYEPGPYGGPCYEEGPVEATTAMPAVRPVRDPALAQLPPRRPRHQLPD